MRIQLFIKHALVVMGIAYFLTLSFWMAFIHALFFLALTSFLQFIQKKTTANHPNYVRRHVLLLTFLSVFGFNFVLNSFEGYRELTVLNRHGVNFNRERYYQEVRFDGNLYVLYESGYHSQTPQAFKLKRHVTGNYLEHHKDATRFGFDGSVVVLIDYEDEVILVFGSKERSSGHIVFKQLDGGSYTLDLNDVANDYFYFTYHFEDIHFDDKTSPILNKS